MSRRPLYSSGDNSPSRGSLDSRDSFDLTVEDPESQTFHTNAFSPHRRTSVLSKLSAIISAVLSSRKLSRLWRTRRHGIKSDREVPQSWRPWSIFQVFLAFTLIIHAFVIIWFPSYANPPARYGELRQQVKSSSRPGRANVGNEKVFIAASIFDSGGKLARGEWGKRIMRLVDLLGPSNVFLSIYEDGAGPIAKAALKELEEQTKCEHALVFDDESQKGSVPTVQLPDGSSRVKRIEYLATVRNRALAPLETASIRYDKLLYLNDVIFDPTQAVQLLFATNAEQGKADYRAACALDFINPFKFYDTFASRDLEGYSMGLPIYPWFSSAGKAQSRHDVLNWKDAVRVRSCWGGMVAFDAQFFQSAADDLEDLGVAGNVDGANFTGFRFRAEQELFWEPSECCLIHADIQKPDQENSGIYMNPYVRVAYSLRTLSWLGWSRRMETLFSPYQYMINRIVGLPWYNSRRGERQWQEVQEKVWTPDEKLAGGGSFQLVDRIARHDGFCGTRSLEVLKMDPKPGEKSWEFIPVPNP